VNKNEKQREKTKIRRRKKFGLGGTRAMANA